MIKTYNGKYTQNPFSVVVHLDYVSDLSQLAGFLFVKSFCSIKFGFFCSFKIASCGEILHLGSSFKTVFKTTSFRY